MIFRPKKKDSKPLFYEGDDIISGNVPVPKVKVQTVMFKLV